MTGPKMPGGIEFNDNGMMDKSPNDSLQNYFDDLLLGAECEADIQASLDASISSSFQAESFLPARTTAGSVSKVRAKPSTATASFADPALQQKINLQRLLHSVTPVIQAVQAEAQLAPSEKIVLASVPATNSREIQEWEIEVEGSIALDLGAQSLREPVRKTYHLPGVEWLANGLPQWGQAKFEVLLVKVSGLTLAVPLMSLGHIQPISDELTHLFGQADWFIGMQSTPTSKISIVNTAKFVMPERYDENFVKSAKLLVSINGVPWGLAVDSVNQPISVEPGAIKWRTDRSKRPWLAGIIKEQMCALLDIPMIAHMLMESDKNLVKNHL